MNYKYKIPTKKVFLWYGSILLFGIILDFVIPFGSLPYVIMIILFIIIIGLRLVKQEMLNIHESETK